MDTPAPGWHPDPTRRHDYRYWDGERWTDDVADGGVTSTDPVDAAPLPDDPTAVHPSPGPGRKRLSPAVIAALAVAAVALIGGVAYVVTRDDGNDSADEPAAIDDEDSTGSTGSTGSDDGSTGSDDGGTDDNDDATRDEGDGDDITSPEDIDDRDELVEFLADNLEQGSFGAIDRDEALCISEGLVDELGIDDLDDLGQAGEDPLGDADVFSELPNLIEDCGVSLEDFAPST